MQYRVWRNAGRYLNRRAKVEQYLFDIAADRRPPPTKAECRALALYLGRMDVQWPIKERPKLKAVK
jgi:hypothetical protein